MGAGARYVPSEGAVGAEGMWRALRTLVGAATDSCRSLIQAVSCERTRRGFFGVVDASTSPRDADEDVSAAT